MAGGGGDQSRRIGPEVVAKVARLARLDLEPDEAVRLADQLSGMLEHFADVDRLDLGGVEPLAQPLPLSNVMREDVVAPCLGRDEVLASAPAAEDGRFRVPPVVGFTE